MKQGQTLAAAREVNVTAREHGDMKEKMRITPSNIFAQRDSKQKLLKKEIGLKMLNRLKKCRISGAKFATWRSRALMASFASNFWKVKKEEKQRVVMNVLDSGLTVMMVKNLKPMNCNLKTLLTSVN